MGEKHIGLFELKFNVKRAVTAGDGNAGNFFDVKIVAGVFA